MTPEQLPLLPGDAPRTTAMQVVNVASVPQRSPFRYPGGKTWLVPYIRRWLRTTPQPVNTFVEPFCGGASVGLTVAFERLAETVVLAELDADIAAVWSVILAGDAEGLARRILEFTMTPNTLNAALERAAETPSMEEIAFATILRNRVNRGGILAAGAGRVKQGENGKGLQSRWYPATLARRIRDIHAVRERITFRHDDAFAVMASFQNTPGTVLFLDPPYTASESKRAGARLYRHFEIDHPGLFATARDFPGDVLLTYDNAEGVRRMADAVGLAYRPVAMKSTHHATQTELLIGKDLRWMD